LTDKDKEKVLATGIRSVIFIFDKICLKKICCIRY